MKKIYIYLIVIVALFIMGVLLANLLIMPYLVHMGEEVTVPNVINMPLNTAVQELKKHGLEGVVVERRYDLIIGEDKIVIQEPLPEVKVKKGRIINLTVSLGAETIKIPDLTGVDLEKGKLIIKRLDLVIDSIDSLPSDSVTAGKIIKTSPNFGADVKRGSAIALVVSTGVNLRMPNLVGIKLIDAKNIIEKMGLVMGEIKRVEASGTSGNIIVQDPEPQRVVNPGDTVSLMVIQ